MNPFQDAPQMKKMFTMFGLYVGIVSQMVISVSFSGILPLAALDFPADGENWPLAVSISGIIGIIIMPMFGYLGAKSPHIKRLLLAVSLFVGAAVLLGRGFAPNMMVIILFSAFWGIVSAGIFVLGFSMVREMFDQKQSGVYLGVLGSMVSLGTLIGPFLSGFVMDNFGWRPMLIIAGVVMVIAGFLIVLGVKVTKADAQPFAVASAKFDGIGAACMAVFLACLIFALSMTSYFPLGSFVSNLLFIVAAISLIAFIADTVMKKDDAFVPAKVFKDRNAVIFATCNFLSLFSVMVVIAFLPSFIRGSMIEDPIVQTIGISMASLLPASASAILGLFLGPVFGKMIASTGNARTVLAIGTICRFIAFVGLLMNFLGVFGSVNYILILVFMFILGVANIQNNVTYSAGPQIQIAKDKRVQANSIVQLGQNLGGGAAVPVYTMVIVFSMGVSNAMPTMMIMGLVAIVILFFVGLLLKPLPKD
jgi:MFS family permease